MEEFIQSLGQVTAVIGAQWGDEGKGKVTDILGEHLDIIARATGGANAGHTVVVHGKKYVFHLLPSGALHEGKPVILGAGMAIHLPTLLEEIETLEQEGVAIVDRLSISHAAHIVFEYHKEIDRVMEERRKKSKGEGIGTTLRGIGPAYTDKARRTGLRMELLTASQEEIRSALEHQKEFVKDIYGVDVDVDGELSHLLTAQKKLEARIGETVVELHNYMNEGKTILIEGAQATLLDLDHGTYPYVTSSNTTATGALQGLGLPPYALTACIGVAKAYCTRVGSGDFSTEADEETANRLRERGGEYGATTGRPRRTGWLHVTDLQYGAAINGFTHWNITKLDVLDEEDMIPVGVGMDDEGKATYEELPGWKASTSGLTDFEKLPENAQAFLSYIEEQTNVPVSLIGTGQGREEMIVR